MKKMNKSNRLLCCMHYLMVLCCLSLTFSAKGQSLQPNYGAPASPLQVANGPGTFKVRINGSASACATSTLNITLPPGYVYVSGSASVTAGSGTVSQTSANNNTAVLSIGSIPAAPDSTVITYQAYAGCSVIGSNNTNISYTLNGCNSSAASSIVNAQNAQLNITNVTNNAFSGTIGQSYTRVITVTNNGIGTIDTIYLDSKNGTGLTITSTTANTGAITVSKTWTGTDTTYTYRITAPTANGHLENGEAVQITETVQIVGCQLTGTNFKSWFGLNGVECSAVSNLATAGATINSSVQPNLVATTIETPNMKCLPTAAGDGWVTFQLTNTSTVPALISTLALSHSLSACHACPGAVGVSGTYGGNTCGTRTLSIDTAAGITYSINGGTTWTPLNYIVYQYYENWAAGGNFNAGKPMALRFENGITQIDGGQSVRIRLRINDQLPSCCQADWYQGSFSFGGSYTDVCGNNPKSISPAASLDLNSTQRYSMNSTSAADAIGGSAYNLTYAGFIVTTNNANRNDNTGYVDYEITLPTSLDPSTAAADHSLTRGATVVMPSSVTWNAATRKLRVRFLRNTVASTSYAAWNLSIKTTVNCAGTGGTASLNAFVKLSDCATQEWQALCNKEANFTVHGCGLPGCEGPLNYATKVRRTNYGIYSATNNGVPGGILDTANLNLNNTLFGDTVAVVTTSKIQGTNSFSNIFVSIAKTEADAIHPFVDAIAYIYNGSGTTIVSGINAGTATGTTPSTRVISLATGTGAPASYAPGDSIVVVTRFRQLVNTDKRVDFTTTTFASNSTTFGDASQIACDGNWTGTVYNYGTFIQPQGNPTILFTDCVNSSIAYSLTYLINPSAPAETRHARFQNEIRRLFDLDSLRMVLPPGFEITNMSVKILGQNVAASTGINSLPLAYFNAGNNSYYYDLSGLENTFMGTNVPLSEGFTLVATPTFRATCKIGNFSGNDNIASISTKNSQLTSTSPTWVGSVMYLGSIDNSFAPISLNTSSANKTVNTDTVSWEIQVTNPTSVTKSNAWLAEGLGINGTTIFSVQELSGAGGIVVSTATASNGIYQLGNITAGTTKYIKVNSTFTNCVKDSMKILVDYNCSAYPPNLLVAESGCKVQSLGLTVTAQTPALQLAIINQPPSTGTIDLCDNIPYELEITNSGLGSADTLQVRVQIPSTGGIQYAPGTFGFKYPNTAASYTPLADANVTVQGNFVTFSIPVLALASLPGTEKYRIKFDMRTFGCSFTSGEKLIFRPVGKNACNENLLGTSVAGNRINLTGVPPNLPEFTISSMVDSVTACGTGAVSTNYRIKVINTGTLITSLTDGFRITLPSPWTMNTAVTYIHNPSGATYSMSPAAGVYDFKTGVGLALGDSIVLTATLNAASASALACNLSAPITEAGFVEFTATCSLPPSAVCNTKQLLEPINNTTAIFVKKPSYSITGFTGAASGTPPNHVVGTFTLTNANSTFTPQNGTLNVYQDVNANGVYDAGDVTLGSQVYPIANLATQTLAYDITVTGVEGNVCPIVATLNLACNCDTPSFSYNCASVVLPIKFFGETAKVDGCNVQLEWNYEATQTIVTGFELQRTNALKTNWETIATLGAAQLSYDDVTPSAGTWLYRVLALNTENETVYSRTLNASTKCKGSAIQLYPNPTKEMINVSLQGSNEDEVPYYITDKLGRNIQKGKLKGNSQNTISLTNLSSGMYHLHILYGENKFVEKIDIVK